jgi:hypothetical protein
LRIVWTRFNEADLGAHEKSHTQVQGEVLPAQDAPFGVEVLHESERTRVTRLFLPGGTVVCKEPLGPDAQRRLEHEQGMLERLRG